MLKHIDQLENNAFGQQVLHMQNYREKILEEELNKVKEVLNKNRSTREEELMADVQRLQDQKFNTEMLFNRLQVANKMLSKQLQ